MLYRMLIIDRYSCLYSYSSTSTRTRTRTHVIIKYSYSYSDSHILQVLILVLVLVNLVLAPALVNPLAHERCWSNFTSASFKIILQIDILSTPSDIGLSWVPLNLTDGKSTLVQVMAWCCQATTHYLIQCWPRSISPYGITGPQWVNVIWMKPAIKKSNN